MVWTPLDQVSEQKELIQTGLMSPMPPMPSVLQQSFKEVWHQPKLVRANDLDWQAMQRYRTDWFAALTGLHAKVYAYG